MFISSKIILVLEAISENFPISHVSGSDISDYEDLNIAELCTYPFHFNADAFLQKQVKRRFDYNEEEGKLTYKELGPVGKVGTKQKGGAIYINFKGKQYPAASLIWLYVHGVLPNKIPWHKNGDFSDDRIENLHLRE